MCFILCLGYSSFFCFLSYRCVPFPRDFRKHVLGYNPIGEWMHIIHQIAMGTVTRNDKDRFRERERWMQSNFMFLSSFLSTPFFLIIIFIFILLFINYRKDYGKDLCSNVNNFLTHYFSNFNTSIVIGQFNDQLVCSSVSSAAILF